MGIYLRKSINVGPLRFNLSKSGIGISTGFKGFRIGSGPRGNYVHMGRGGVQYRATLPPASHPAPKYSDSPDANPTIQLSTHAPLERIESADVSQIVDSSSQELLNELNEKWKRPLIWPWVAAASAIAYFGIPNEFPNWSSYVVFILGCIAIYYTYTKDLLNKTVVLFYEFEPDIEVAYTGLHDAAEQLASCAASWHIAAAGQVYDPKYHAGAGALVQRKKTSIKKAEPPFLKTNIETIQIGVGRQVLHFFPDRVLIFDKGRVGAINYQDLIIEVSPKQFIEEQGVPRDAKVVDRTWRYVNKKGGPDKRFKDNREIPVCLYDELQFSSHTGLNEVIQISKAGIGSDFANAVKILARLELNK